MPESALDDENIWEKLSDEDTEEIIGYQPNAPYPPPEMTDVETSDVEMH